MEQEDQWTRKILHAGGCRGHSALLYYSTRSCLVLPGSGQGQGSPHQFGKPPLPPLGFPHPFFIPAPKISNAFLWTRSGRVEFCIKKFATYSQETSDEGCEPCWWDFGAGDLLVSLVTY
jgi:hypothetical protein